ncbi:MULTISPECIES: pyridoxamine 5'-phosphate oxidase [Brevibacterium]|jgi:pyridoxamine 5'-phosphate oxidase|uniref:Pyridoxine/pyridoxamine 5'-phosphate oxidase n=1 Tax=Brevibacterium salitolerans TaxID=1403566 RepID=A0ABP5I474_9MICO|nr:pyridoxamine 5'-phosphate oxidase [Brevibacterium sp.]
MSDDTAQAPADAQEALARLARQRVEYDDADLALPGDSPAQVFSEWYAEAGRALTEPNAMVVATADDAGPAARIVLLKEFDADGFVFYTNYLSAKGRQIEAHPLVALVFPWHEMQRQVRVRGVVEKVSPEQSDAYFALRPRGSQLGAIVSEQSRPIASRAEFEERSAALEAEVADREPTRPPHWGGYRVRPYEIEFWQGRRNRMHDRFLLTSRDGAPAPLDDPERWSQVRLQP